MVLSEVCKRNRRPNQKHTSAFLRPIIVPPGRKLGVSEKMPCGSRSPEPWKAVERFHTNTDVENQVFIKLCIRPLFGPSQRVYVLSCWQMRKSGGSGGTPAMSYGDFFLEGRAITCKSCPELLGVEEGDFCPTVERLIIRG